VLDLPGATIDDACRPGGTILYVGPDPKEELPVLFLRLKHAVVEDGVRIVEVTPTRTGLTRYAASSLHPRPGEVAAVVAALVGATPSDGAGGVPAEDLAAAADLLDGVDDLVVVVGRANLAESPAAVLGAAAAVHSARPAATFLPVLRRANVRGALAAGLTPGRLPGGIGLEAGREAWTGVWPALPEAAGLDADGILDAAANGRIDALVLLGADPLRDHPDTALARRALAGARTIIALDQFRTPSVEQADVVLPVAGFAEVDGTTTNLEGRVSVLHAAVTPPGTARADWMVAVELSHRLGVDLGVTATASELWDELVANAPALAAVTGAALAEDTHADGVLVDLAGRTSAPPEPVEPPATNAYTSRLVLSRVLYDGGEQLSHRPSSSGLVRAGTLRLSPADAAPLGVADGDRVTVTSQHGSVTAPVTVDVGVPKGTVVAHHALDPDVSPLLGAGDVVCDVRVEVA
jgi:NADH-quinone oxidoreductase subunit G